MTRHHVLDVPGARLHYEVRGDGPLLLVMGSPMDATMFEPVADALAADYTVVTHDPRGISRSPIDDPEQHSTPDLRADDVAAMMDALGAESADVFGSSGGAVTVLALATRHPGRVRTVVAHEPPLLELLPADEVAAQRAGTAAILETFRREGVEAAWGRFMANAGVDLDGEEGQGPPVDDLERHHANSVRFFGHELLHTVVYRPDVAALTSDPGRVVVGIGAESRELVTYRTSVALAERLGTEWVEFPGDHGGFLGEPAEFAEALRKVLAR